MLGIARDLAAGRAFQLDRFDRELEVEPGRFLAALAQGRDGGLADQGSGEFPLAPGYEVFVQGENGPVPARKLQLPGLRDPLEQRRPHGEAEIEREVLADGRADVFALLPGGLVHLLDDVRAHRAAGKPPGDAAGLSLQHQRSMSERDRLDLRGRVDGHPLLRRAGS